MKIEIMYDNHSRYALNLHHLLRVYVPQGCEELCTKDILDYCRRTGCSEVLLFTTSYDAQPSFVDLDQIRIDVERSKAVADNLRKDGIAVSVNVLQTLGHVYFPRKMDREFPFHRRVYSDGRKSTEGACPLCPNLREWIASAYRLYAELNPRILFVDDDYRTFMQGLSCFCERHLEEMSNVAGRTITRQEVVLALKDSNWPPDPLRIVFHEVTTKGLCELARSIREAIHSVSPGTRIGLMACRPPTGEMGMDIACITAELAGPHQPLVRPQSGMYSEGFIRDIPHHFMETDWLRAIVPPEFEQYPEIENYHYTSYAKSAQCTFVQMAT
ncbi:MAG: hypothetical protein WCP55_26070, partial [Lentisphaerota bacterium]